MHRTDHRRTRTGSWRERVGSRGESRDSSTPGWPLSLLASSSTSSAPETRVSKHQHCGWWARRSSWPAWRAACCVLCFVYSPSPAAGGGPTTRRTEDCPVAWKAKRCRWRGVRARGRARRSARRRGASTRPRATCPASPAARRTSVCAATAPPRSCSRRLCMCSRRGLSQSRRRLCSRRRSRRRSWRCSRPARGRRRGTSRSRAAPTASWCSAPHSYAPNPQAINYVAILFIRTMNVSRNVTCGGKWKSILHV